MLSFTKMHGIGNDYIYIDCITQHVADPEALARQMSDRHFGVGGDGVILILPPKDDAQADLRMRMFNADGSEGRMCGNGIRCVCKLAHDRVLCTARPMRIETSAGVLSIDYTLDPNGRVSTVTVDMGEPSLDPADLPADQPAVVAARMIDLPLDEYASIDLSEPWIDACGLDPRMTCVSMGNPHLVVFCADVDAVPLESIGPRLENLAMFPDRINVHFAEIQGREDIRMRTWERGSGVTLACGTGACAVSVAAALTRRADRAVRVRLPGGELQIAWDEGTNHVFMTGPATEVFTGRWPGHAAVPVAASQRTEDVRTLAPAPRT